MSLKIALGLSQHGRGNRFRTRRGEVMAEERPYTMCSSEVDEVFPIDFAPKQALHPRFRIGIGRRRGAAQQQLVLGAKAALGVHSR